MAFSNLAVAPEALPNATAVTLKPIHSNYLKVLRIVWAIIFGLLLLAVTAIIYWNQSLHHFTAIFFIAGSYLCLLLLTVLIGTGSFKRKAYAIRERDILYRTGWVIQHFHAVPYSRMQHCVVNSGPIERKFGLATVGLYTAASEIKDIKLPGIPLEEAEKIREWILQQIQPITNGNHEL